MDESILEREADRNPLDFISVSKAELEVFRLIPELCAALNDGYCRYMRMVGYIACSDDHEERQRASDKAAFWPTIERANCQRPSLDANLCAVFMNEFCGLPFDQAYAWHRRVEAQEWRQGLKPIRGVTVSDQYRALQGDKTNKLTTAALIKKDGTTTIIAADNVPF